MKRFVIVHGIRPKPEPDILAESCRHFLSKSTGVNLQPEQIQIAYWADIAGYAHIPDDRGSFKPFTFMDRITLAALEIAKGLVVEKVEKHLAALLNRNAPPNPDEVVGLLSKTLTLLEDPLTSEIMRAFIKDVHAYFFSGIREPVKDRVRAQLDLVPQGTPVALVGHSMGSVIAMDVLLSDRRKVNWLLTLGSPLGYNAVRAKLAFPPEEWDAIPNLAPRWDNIYDPIDVVSLDSQLADELPAAKPNDLLIHNEFTYSNGKRNHHGLYGFLGHPETGKKVAAFLKA